MLPVISHVTKLITIGWSTPQKRQSKGNMVVMMLGVVMATSMTGVLAVDMPAYFAAQNQLQTAVDAAAIAGAYALPDGETQAEAAAVEVASENPVMGTTLDDSNLTFEYDETSEMTMSVSGEAQVPTLMAKILCGFTGTGGGGNFEGQTQGEGEWEDQGGGGSSSNCNFMTVYAHAKAVPAARDTVIVIDTSSSMATGNQPINAVKTAARNFVDVVNNISTQNQSIDRLALVKFDRTSSKQIGLTKKSDYSGAGFTQVKNKITGLTLYSGSGWNTNYESGLKVALDELEANGRKNAKQTIIFLTDGFPNLPAPASHLSYNLYNPYKKCSDKVDNYSAVRNLCYTYRRNGRTYQQCYYMPSSWPSPITTAMVVNSGGYACGMEYTDYMVAQTQAQVNRAKQLGVTIYTIEMFDQETGSSSSDMLKALRTDADWDPELLDYMANETDGDTYSSANATVGELDEIYTTIANDVKVKLAL